MTTSDRDRPSLAAIIMAAGSRRQALASIRRYHPDASNLEIARALLTTGEVLRAAGVPADLHWLAADVGPDSGRTSRRDPVVRDPSDCG